MNERGGVVMVARQKKKERHRYWGGGGSQIRLMRMALEYSLLTTSNLQERIKRRGEGRKEGREAGREHPESKHVRSRSSRVKKYETG